MAEKPPQYPGMSNEELTTHLFYRLYNEDSTQPRLVSRHGVNSCDPTLGSIHIDRIPPPFTIAVLLDAICTAEGITRDTAKKATIYLPGKKSPAKLKEVLEIIGTAVAPIGSDRGRPFLVVFHGPVPGVVAPETSAQGFQSASQPTAPAPLDAYPPVTTQPAPTPAPRADGWFTQAVEYDSCSYGSKTRPELGPCGHIAVATYLCLYYALWGSCLCCICGGHCEQALKTGCGCPVPGCVDGCC